MSSRVRRRKKRATVAVAEEKCEIKVPEGTDRVEIDLSKLVKDVDVRGSVNAENFEKYRTAIIPIMVSICKRYEALKDHEDFKDLDIKSRTAIFEKEYSEFCKEFPIVVRYLICFGAFDKGAFEKMLKRFYDSKNIPDEKKIPTSKKRSYSEEKWIEYQAEYVKNLYIAECKAKKEHIDHTKVAELFRYVQKSIADEFDQFRKQYSEAEDRVRKTDVVAKKERLVELIDRAVKYDILEDNEIQHIKHRLLFLQQKQYKRYQCAQLRELAEFRKFAAKGSKLRLQVVPPFRPEGVMGEDTSGRYETSRK